MNRPAVIQSRLASKTGANDSSGLTISAMVIAVKVSAMVMAVMIASRRPDFAQSTSWLAVVSATPPYLVNLRPGIIHNALDLLAQNHWHAQIGEKAPLELSLF